MFDIFRDTDPRRQELFIRRADGSRFILVDDGKVLGLASVAEARLLVEALMAETMKLSFLEVDEDA
jgi:hypothetical protein